MAKSEKNRQRNEAGPEVPAKADPTQQPTPKTRVRHLPQYRVLLHNDPVNDMDRVVIVVCKVTPLPVREAIARMLEAHRTGVALLLVTHKELAEMYAEQMVWHDLTVTIEPVG